MHMLEVARSMLVQQINSCTSCNSKFFYFFFFYTSLLPVKIADIDLVTRLPVLIAVHTHIHIVLFLFRFFCGLCCNHFGLVWGPWVLTLSLDLHVPFTEWYTE